MGLLSPFFVLFNSIFYIFHTEKNGSFSGKIQKIVMREKQGFLGVFWACENCHLYIQTL